MSCIQYTPHPFQALIAETEERRPPYSVATTARTRPRKTTPTSTRNEIHYVCIVIPPCVREGVGIENQKSSAPKVRYLPAVHLYLSLAGIAAVPVADAAFAQPPALPRGRIGTSAVYLAHRCYHRRPRCSRCSRSCRRRHPRGCEGRGPLGGIRRKGTGTGTAAAKAAASSGPDGEIRCAERAPIRPYVEVGSDDLGHVVVAYRPFGTHGAFGTGPF